MKVPNSLSNVHIAISNEVLWIIFLFSMIVFVLSAIIFGYHWQHYGTDDHRMHRVTAIYVGVGVGLLVLSAFLIKIR